MAFVVLLVLQTRPSSHDYDALRGDSGARLTLMDALFSGKRLYGDAAWLYGPLTILPAATTVSVLGDATKAIVLVDSLVNAAALGLLYVGMRRVLTRGWALSIGMGILVPTLLSLTGCSAYNSWLWLLNAALGALWTPPARRSRGRSFVAGALLGALQLAKFGSHVAAAAAWLVLEFTTWDGKGFLRGGIALLAGYLATIVPFAAWLYHSVGSDMALDVLWPAWVFEAYARHTAPSWGLDHFVHHMGPGYLLGVILPQVVCLLLGLAAISPWGGRMLRTMEAPPSSLAFLPLFYVFSALSVVKHVFHHFQYAPFVYPGAAVVPLIKSVHFRWLAALVLAAAALLQWRPLVRANPPAQTHPLVTPSGQVVQLQDSARVRYLALFDLLKGESPSSRLSILGEAESPGLYHFLGVQPPSRHFWFTKSAVRTHEAARVRAQIRSAPLLFVLEPESDAADPRAVAVRLLGLAGVPDPEELIGTYCFRGNPEGFLLFSPGGLSACDVAPTSDPLCPAAARLRRGRAVGAHTSVRGDAGRGRRARGAQLDEDGRHGPGRLRVVR